MAGSGVALLAILTYMTISFGIRATRARPFDRHHAESVVEKLKLGDPVAWREYGPEVVDIVYRMVESGQAEDPFDALLLFFYPNSTPEERKEILKKFRPMLSALMQLTSQGEDDDDELDLDDWDETNDDQLKRVMEKKAKVKGRHILG